MSADLKRAYLHAMEIPIWQSTSRRSPEPPSTCEWRTLEAAVSHCTACPLHQSRTQTVFGAGHTKASVMFIGEAPGFHEDQQGEPFVGRAGQLLNAMLDSIGLNRQTVYIANILKCRPPNNRDPLPNEIAHCRSFLNQQIALVQPKLLVALGRIAAQTLLQTQKPLGQLRKQPLTYGHPAIPCIVTYHPAYLLRNPSDKANAWEDLQWIYREISTDLQHCP